MHTRSARRIWTVVSTIRQSKQRWLLVCHHSSIFMNENWPVCRCFSLKAAYFTQMQCLQTTLSMGNGTNVNGAMDGLLSVVIIMLIVSTLSYKVIEYRIISIILAPQLPPRLTDVANRTFHS